VGQVLAAVAAVFILTAAAPAGAQTDAGALRVLVSDPTGAVVPGASVDLTNVGTNVTQSAVSDGEGYVAFAPLQPATYSVRVSLSGFQTVEVSNVTVDVAERRLLRVGLEAASLQEAVEVVSSAAFVQTEDASLGEVIKGAVAVELPLAGRRYTELALLVPGATSSTMTLTTRGPGWFLVNGNYHTQNNFILDGFDNNQGTQNAQSLSAQVVQPSPDAIGEFKVQTNSFSAEYGRSAGAVVNVSLKSGTNALRGSAFYYNRDASLAATSWNANLIGAPKDTLEWHQGGGTAGGPILRDKLFYFGSYEGFRRSFSDSFILTVPTDAQRTGLFASDIIDPSTGQPFPGRQIPQSRWDPLGKKVLDLFPAPNLPGRTVSGGRVVENYGVQRDGREDTHKLDVRTDYVASTQDRAFFRFSFLQQDIFRDALFDTIGEGTSNQGEQFNRNYALGASWNRIIGSRMVNEVRFGYNDTHARFAHAAAEGPNAADFGFTGYPAELLTTGGIPLMDFSNYQDLGIRNFRPQYQDPRSFQFLDTLTLQFGRQTVRAGGEVRVKRSDVLDVVRRSPVYTFGGQYTGNDIADLLLGYPVAFRATTVPEIDYRQEVYAAFVQSDWKLRPDLTLNLGLRYEYGTPYYGNGENPNVNFDLATGQLVVADGGDKYLVDADRNNFGPRLGVAWQPWPDRLVVRGGAGVFYSIEDMRGSEGMLPLNPPALVDSEARRVGSGPPPIRLSDPFPPGFLDRYVPGRLTLTARDREQDAATVYQWNTAAEFLLPWDSTLEVAYVGNLGRNLLTVVPVNAVPFGVDGSVPANRPYPAWSQIQLGITRSQSVFNSLQAKYEKRFSRGVYLLGSYTYARAEDETGAWGAGGSGVQVNILPDLSNADAALRAERGPNGQVARHRFTFTEVWQLPVGRGRAIGTDMPVALDALVGNWQVSSITTVRTGLPVSVGLAASGVNPATGASYSFLNRNGGSLRPNLIGDPNANSDASGNRTAFLNPGAYAVQPVNTPGDAPRNSAWGPGFWQIDLSLVKRFPFGSGRSYADVRVEAFNLLNHTNFGDPNGTFGSSSFGAITTAGDPRVVQLAVRLAF
jgi:hypothetical protein